MFVDGHLGAMDAAGPPGGGDERSIVTDDDLHIQKWLDQPHVSVSSEGSADRFPGGLVDKENIRSVGSLARTVVQKEPDDHIWYRALLQSLVAVFRDHERSPVGIGGVRCERGGSSG